MVKLPRRKAWWAVGALLVSVTAMVSCFWLTHSSYSGSAAVELFAEPAEFDALDELSWKPLPVSLPSTKAWESEKLDGRRRAFVIEVVGHTANLAAVWDYASSKRINFEEDFPGQTVDIDADFPLNADESDIYCVDIERSLDTNKFGCAVWVFWARYGNFRVSMSLDNATLLDANGFLSMVKEYDSGIVKKLTTS